MNIQIKRYDLTKEQLEKLRFDLIYNTNPKVPIKYNWNLKGDCADESIEDFHLFCISIVRELFENNFKTNEFGEVSYPELEEYDFEDTIQDLSGLFQIISRKKLTNES